MNHDLEYELGFSREDIAACLAGEGLLSLEVEFTRKCNLRCVYCYSSAGDSRDGELTLEELVRVLEQARQLGAKKIVLLGGGEPFPGRDGRSSVQWRAKHRLNKGRRCTISWQV